jgi:hypothetical protein
MRADTTAEFLQVIHQCKALFLLKTRDYGTAWRILRLSSITDQLYIKAMRIRNIEEKGTQKITDSVRSEYIGLVNYSILALIQMHLPATTPLELDEEAVTIWYDREVDTNTQLLSLKNHDYNEAWRDMRLSSMTDLILQKLLRIKQIEDNNGQTAISEGLEANYRDIINYAVFCLIRIAE